MVLRRCTHHRGTADVDLLHDGVLRGTGGHRLRERIEIHDDEVERLHAKIGELLAMVRTTLVSQQAGVDQRMQGLDPAIQALLEAGHLGDFGHRHVRGGDPLRSGAGGHDLHTGGVQPFGEVFD